MKPLLTALWPQFNADAAFAESFAGVLVERVEANRNKKTVTVVYRSVRPISSEMTQRLAASLPPFFPGFLVKLQGLFSYDYITPETVLDLANQL